MKPIEDILRDTEKSLRELERCINSKKELERIHRDNMFNRRFSRMLTAFTEFKAIANRLHRNIVETEDLNRQIQRRLDNEDKDGIKEEGKALMQVEYWKSMENQADFKSMYMFAKIFADKYTSLIRHIFNWRGIGDKSVTNFHNDLEKYSGGDVQIELFKSTCLNKLRAFNLFITGYRDKFIVHDETDHKETRWTFNDMAGNIRFFGSIRPSITPNELVFVVAGYITDTSVFVCSNI